ncbi:hypothetical protein EDD22DRAFT_786211, partial [Suillus occidentalis]
MWRTCFRHLLGWDFEMERSTARGGIFGHIQAFYGSSEYTERGSLHGHYLLWLDGGSNPSDIHRKLRDDDYQRRFFAFFEDIIHHHLPDVEVEINSKFDPRVERPPEHCAGDAAEWNSTFATQVKQCGEALQHHTCRAVCHKYGNTDNCRFLFPHDVVDQSSFDVDSNSVVFKCEDGTVNYFNPSILVFCRHNHDVRCILSGKSAKAAMFYISDYITKMDTKTYEMLSLLSRAVSRLPINQAEQTPVDIAKTLLHKCLAQFTRQQQIHAQQAARYVRGLGDGIPLHRTAPMLSSLLLSYIKATIEDTENVVESMTHNVTVGNGDDDDEDPVVEVDDEAEDVWIRVTTDNNGEIVECNQIHHYIYRASTLDD